MPRLWTETIDAHRQAVRDATVDTTAALVAKHGLRSVTMSQIAERTGIGRATLYKYFPDVESILVAWHERHVAGHLKRLAALAREPGPPLARLQAVLEAFAAIESRRHAHEISALVHRAEHVARAEQHLHDLLRGLVVEGGGLGKSATTFPPTSSRGTAFTR